MTTVAVSGMSTVVGLVRSTVVKDGVSVLADSAGDGGVVLRAPGGLNVTTVAMSISSTVATLIVSAAAILSSGEDLPISIDVSTVVE
jgi:hypothetical protein